MSQEDDGDSNTDNSGGGNAPINGSKKFGDCYLEVTKFDLDATKKKSNDLPRDALKITKLAYKTSSFVCNTAVKFWIEIDRLRVEKELDAEIKRHLIPESITAAT